MTSRNNILPFVVAMKLPDESAPWYYLKKKRWTRDPRQSVHLSNDAGDRLVSRLTVSHSSTVIFVKVDIEDAIRLYRLSERRGDIRSLQSPEEAGKRTLAAR